MVVVVVVQLVVLLVGRPRGVGHHRGPLVKPPRRRLMMIVMMLLVPVRLLHTVMMMMVVVGLVRIDGSVRGRGGGGGRRGGGRVVQIRVTQPILGRDDRRCGRAVLPPVQHRRGRVEGLLGGGGRRRARFSEETLGRGGGVRGDGGLGEVVGRGQLGRGRDRRHVPSSPPYGGGLVVVVVVMMMVVMTPLTRANVVGIRVRLARVSSVHAHVHHHHPPRRVAPNASIGHLPATATALSLTLPLFAGRGGRGREERIREEALLQLAHIARIEARRAKRDDYRSSRIYISMTIR